MLPLVVVLGSIWGAEGAAAAVLAGMCAFAAAWTVIFLRVRPDDVGPVALDEALAEEEAEAGVLLR